MLLYNVKELMFYVLALMALSTILDSHSLILGLSLSDIIFSLVFLTTTVFVIYKGSISYVEISVLSVCLVLTFLSLLSFKIENIYGHLSWVRTFAKWNGFVFVYFYWIDKEDVGKVIIVLILAGCIVVLGSVFQYYTGLEGGIFSEIYGQSRFVSIGINLDISRYSGLIPTYGTYGMYVTTASLSIVSLSLYKNNFLDVKKWGKLSLLTISVVLAMIGITLTQSRSLLLSYVIGLSTVLFYTGKKRPIYGWFFWALLIPSTVLFYPYISGIVNYLSSVDLITIYNRLYQFKYILSFNSYEYIFGSGLGNVIVDNLGGKMIHNTFLFLTYHNGIFMSTIYLISYCYILFMFYRGISKEGAGYVNISIISSLIAHFIEHLFFNGSVVSLSAVLFGISLSYILKAR